MATKDIASAKRSSGNKFSVYDLCDKDNTPKNIFQAAEKGSVVYINIIMDNCLEFDPNTRDDLQRTALHWAAEMGRLEAAQLLMDNGCDVTALECNGRTAIHFAARSVDMDMLHKLLDDQDKQMKAVLVNQPDKHGITPMYLVLQRVEDCKGALDYLVQCGGRFEEIAELTPST